MEDRKFRVEVLDAQLQLIFQKPVLVQWCEKEGERYRYLGRLSEDNANFTLWMGYDVKNEEKVLINFHLPVVTRTSASQTAKNMYLVIPAEELAMSMFFEAVKDLPADTRSQLRKAGSLESSTIAHIRFDLRSLPDVVMPIPRRKMHKPLEGRPRELLSCLRSLSEAKSLDIYLQDEDSTGEQLLQICEKFQNGSLVTPLVDFSSTYGDGFFGGKNNWEDYPCHAPVGASWNPFVEPAPPYEEVVRLSSPQHDPRTLVSLRNGRGACLGTAPERDNNGTHPSSHERQPGFDHFQQPKATEASPHAEGSNSPQSRDELPHSSDKPANAGSDCGVLPARISPLDSRRGATEPISSHLAKPPTAHGRPHNDRTHLRQSGQDSPNVQCHSRAQYAEKFALHRPLRKRSFDDAFQGSESSAQHHLERPIFDLALSHEENRERPEQTDDLEPPLQYGNDSGRQRNGNPELNHENKGNAVASEGSAEPTTSLTSPTLVVQRGTPHPEETPTEPAPAEETPGYLQTRLFHWILHSWDLDPRSHETFATQLKQLGRAVREGDYGNFEGIWVRLVESLTDNSPNTSPGPLETCRNAEQLGFYVQNFIHRRICLFGEPVVFRELRGIKRSMAWVEATKGQGDDAEEARLARNLVREQLAWLLSIAFVRAEKSIDRTVTPTLA